MQCFRRERWILQILRRKVRIREEALSSAVSTRSLGIQGKMPRREAELGVCSSREGGGLRMWIPEQVVFKAKRTGRPSG